MLYVLIPCLILLVVALILKKRESANTDAGPEKSKKIATKKTTKKTPTRSSNSVQTKTVDQPNAKVVESSSTPLNENFKTTIEKLIQSKNYSAAEAKINQALNQDSSFHELYFYLLEIHVAQNDELATKQLINYLKSLGLYDVADQITLKQNATKSHSHHIPVNSDSSIKSFSESNSTAAFDALIENKIEHKQAPTTLATPYELNLNETKVSDLQPLEYSVEKQTPDIQSVPLDFNFKASEEPKITEQPVDAVKNITPETIPVDDVKPLEFNFDLAPRVEEKLPTPVAPSFNQNDLTFETKSPISEIKAEVEPATTQIKNEFNFDLDQNELNNTVTNNFEFKLDTPVSTTRSTFEYDPNEFKVEEPVIATEAHKDTDPLAQSFPELLSTNEAQLNLDLAQQYIKLGAYDAAKRLISEKAAQYSAEQRTHSEKLMNQLAS